MSRIEPMSEEFKAYLDRKRFFVYFRHQLKTLKVGDHFTVPYKNPTGLHEFDFRARARSNAKRVGIRIITGLTVYGIYIRRVEDKK